MNAPTTPTVSPAPAAPSLEECRTARDTARKVLAQKRGQLVNAARVYREKLPDRVGAALEQFERAEDVLDAIEHEFRGAMAARHDPADLPDAQRRARISALIEAHVMGGRLVLVPNQRVYRWMTTDENQKHRAIPNYAADPGSIAHAVAAIPRHKVSLYGACLLGTADIPRGISRHEIAALVATASPIEQAVALLATFEIDENADPPTVAE